MVAGCCLVQDKIRTNILSLFSYHNNAVISTLRSVVCCCRRCCCTGGCCIRLLLGFGRFFLLCSIRVRSTLLTSSLLLLRHFSLLLCSLVQEPAVQLEIYPWVLHLLHTENFEYSTLPDSQVMHRSITRMGPALRRARGSRALCSAGPLVPPPPAVSAIHCPFNLPPLR